MYSRNLKYMVDLINQTHQGMALDDGGYYLDAVEHINRALTRLSNTPGLGHINCYDLLVQQETRSLKACEQLNDLNHKAAMFLGMCYEQLPDMGGANDHQDLGEHLSEIAALDQMSPVERSDFNQCLETLRNHQGSRPLMLVRLWQARNDLGKKLETGLEVSEDVVALFEAGIQSYLPGRKRPEPKTKPAPHSAPASMSMS